MPTSVVDDERHASYRGFWLDAKGPVSRVATANPWTAMLRGAQPQGAMHFVRQIAHCQNGHDIA
jgi:hypothetical protein